MTAQDDPKYGIAANVITDSILRTGSKVWLRYCNGDCCHPLVIGRNRQGRLIEKYIPYKRLTNYRATWVPEHLRERHYFRFLWETRREAKECAREFALRWADVRFFNREGSQLLKDGIPELEAFDD